MCAARSASTASFQIFDRFSQAFYFMFLMLDNASQLSLFLLNQMISFKINNF